MGHWGRRTPRRHARQTPWSCSSVSLTTSDDSAVRCRSVLAFAAGALALTLAPAAGAATTAPTAASVPTGIGTYWGAVAVDAFHHQYRGYDSTPRAAWHLALEQCHTYSPVGHCHVGVAAQVFFQRPQQGIEFRMKFEQALRAKYSSSLA